MYPPANQEGVRSVMWLECTRFWSGASIGLSFREEHMGVKQQTCLNSRHFLMNMQVSRGEAAEARP